MDYLDFFISGFMIRSMNSLALLPMVKVANKFLRYNGHRTLHPFGHQTRSQRPRQSVQRREFHRPNRDMSTRSRPHQKGSDP